MQIYKSLHSLAWWSSKTASEEFGCKIIFKLKFPYTGNEPRLRKFSFRSLISTLFLLGLVGFVFTLAHSSWKVSARAACVGLSAWGWYKGDSRTRDLSLDNLYPGVSLKMAKTVLICFGILYVKVSSNYSGLKKQAGFSLKIHDTLSEDWCGNPVMLPAPQAPSVLQRHS